MAIDSIAIAMLHGARQQPACEIIGIYSRKIVGWEMYVNESAEQAADVLRKARFAASVGS